MVDSRRGWLVVAAGFLSMFTVFGVAYSFGAFFRPMADEFGAGRSAIALVFGITAAAYFFLGMVSGRAVDRFGPRPVLLIGAAVMGTGLLLTSRVNQLWHGYITYGGGVGVGVACGYVPMVAVVGGWFEKRRSLALGTAVSGIGFGTLAVAPLAATLIDHYGWRTTDRIFAVAAVVLLVVSAALASPPPRPTAAAPGGVADAVRTPTFALLYGSALLVSVALFVVFVFLAPFAEDDGASDLAASLLIGVVGGSSTAGRFLVGGIADRTGRVRTYRACFFVMALSYVLWLLSPGYAVLVLFAMAFGVGYGGFIALSPAVVAEVFGTGALGATIGILYTSAGFGALVGPSLAGWVVDTFGYRWAIGGAMALALAGWALLLRLRPAPVVSASS